MSIANLIFHSIYTEKNYDFIETKFRTSVIRQHGGR